MRCPPADAHEPHWHTIIADGITIAGGQCSGEARPPVTPKENSVSYSPDTFTAADLAVLAAVEGVVVVDDVDYDGLFDYSDEESA